MHATSLPCPWVFRKDTRYIPVTEEFIHCFGKDELSFSSKCPGARKATTCMKGHDEDNADNLLGSYATSGCPEKTFIFFLICIALILNQT